MNNVRFEINKKVEVIIDLVSYKSIIQDVSDMYISLGVPIKNRTYLTPKQGDIFEVLLYDKSYVYKFEGLVIGLRIENNIPQILIAYPKIINTIQRREFVRVDVVFIIKYFKLSENVELKDMEVRIRELKSYQGILLDLSGGGARIKVNETMKLGNILVIELPSENGIMRLKGNVVRFSKDESGNMFCGICFVEVQNKSREKLIQLIFAIMRKQRKTV